MKNRKKTCQLIQPQAAQVIGGISNPLLSIIAFLPKITEFKTGAVWAVGNQAYPGYCIHNSFLPELLIPILFIFILVENYGSLKSEVCDTTDGSEADRIIIINKPQTQQFCSNKIR